MFSTYEAAEEKATRRAFSVLLADRPGSLSRVVGLFRRRAFNISSLTVGRTTRSGVSRLTIVLSGTRHDSYRFEMNLRKIHDVLEVQNLSVTGAVQREFALIRVECASKDRERLVEMAGALRAYIVELTERGLVLEVSGDEAKVDTVVEMLRPYGLVDISRSGCVAMPRARAKLSVGASRQEYSTSEFGLA